MTNPEASQDTFTPEFSIIVAVYNSERFLAETLRSFQNQTLKHIEVVMVNDGSTDGSASIAERFCLEDARFRLINTPNQGISATRNLAVQHTRAPWIAVCDGDDTWEPNKLQRQAEFIREWTDSQAEQIVAVGTAGDLINSVGAFIKAVKLHPRPWPELLDDEAKMLELNMINSSVVFRRDVFLSIGGYRAEYTPAEDTDLWVRLSEHGAVINLQEPLTHYRMHDTNLSGSGYVRMIVSAKRVRANAARRQAGLPEWNEEDYKAHEQVQDGYQDGELRLRHMVYYNRAKHNMYNRNYSQAARALLSCILVSPRLSFNLLLRSRLLRSGRLFWRKKPDLPG
ncbi:glycosyltransferase family 2 protein [Deinococcus sp.]|uniref:glycosyltransferase family 2 protein n=1 Tax=Deinococcus sp. TaxID=47478 RepID=UPI003C7E16DD